jgi:integrase
MPSKDKYNYEKQVSMNLPDGNTILITKRYYKAKGRKYRTPKAVRLYAEDVLQMLDLAGKYSNRTNDDGSDARERQAVIAALYLTGRRPSEILLWTRNMFQWNEDKLIITAPTLKVEDTGTFYDPEKPFIAQIPKNKTSPSYVFIKALLVWVHSISTPTEKIFKKKVRWMRMVVEELSVAVLGRPFSPYHFRHSLLSFAADAGYSDRQLMAIKNSKSTQSVQAYIHNTTVELDYDRVNRNKFDAHASMPEIEHQHKEEDNDLPTNTQLEQPAPQPEEGKVNPPIQQQYPMPIQAGQIQDSPIQANPSANPEKADEGTMDRSQGASPPDPTPDAVSPKPNTGTAKEAPQA